MNNEPRTMNHKPITSHERRATSDVLNMQNKPNFMKNRANVSYYKSKVSENAPPVFGPKIPNPISPGVQMNLSPYISMNYVQRTMNYPGKNKPKTKPKQSQFLVSLSNLLQIRISK